MGGRTRTGDRPDGKTTQKQRESLESMATAREMLLLRSLVGAHKLFFLPPRTLRMSPFFLATFFRATS